MNELSWFLYFTEMLTNLSTILWIGLVVGGFGLFLTIIFAAIEQDLRYYKFSDNPLWKICRNIGIVLAVSIFIVIFIPSKQTLYMIAASQIGEQIIQLEEVQKLGGDVGGLASDTIELLRQSIQEQLTEKPVQPD